MLSYDERIAMEKHDREMREIEESIVLPKSYKLMDMLYQRAKSYTRKNPQWVCKLCGRGTVSIITDDNRILNCTECGKSDIVYYYARTHGIVTSAGYNGKEYDAAVTALAAIDVSSAEDYDPSPDDEDEAITQEVESNGTTQEADDKGTDATGTNETVSEYYARCIKTLQQSPEALEYLQNKGIFPDTAKNYRIGFDPVADPDGLGEPEPRIIVPTSLEHYDAIAINPDAECQSVSPEDSEPDIFGYYATFHGREPKTVFITDRWIDALSVVEIGQDAIAITSLDNIHKLTDRIKNDEIARKSIFLLALSNDEAGNAAAEAIGKEFGNMSISCFRADITCGEATVNDALCADKQKFAKAVTDALSKATKPDSTLAYLESQFGVDIESNTTIVPTGFPALDAALNGGLHAGFYILAAGTSLGKTTFCSQLCDNICRGYKDYQITSNAKAVNLPGQDVMYFSLEEDRLQMVGRSLARIAYETAFTGDDKKKLSVTASDLESSRKVKATRFAITGGYIGKDANQAINAYKARFADRYQIIEGQMAADITFIKNKIQRFIDDNGGKKPAVVVIDYLQIVNPDTKNGKRKFGDTKEVVDEITKELYHLSRLHRIPIIALSSINRANYLTPIDFEALKESGSLEYSADCVLALDLQEVNRELFNTTGNANLKEKRAAIRDAKAANPRRIWLHALKNRFGIATFNTYFVYRPDHDIFAEDYAPYYTPDGEGTKGKLKGRQ